MNNNPLIDTEPFETLENVKCVVKFLIDYHNEPQFGDLENNRAAIYLMMKCIDEALKHETSRMEKAQIAPT